MFGTSISVAIAGATGYAGGEILRLLLSHPAYLSGELTIGTLIGASNAGACVGDIMPHVTPLANCHVEPINGDTLAGHDTVFLGLSHGHSAATAEQLGDDTVIIDRGADLRLQSAAEWEHHYGSEHAGTWTCDIPELPGNREIVTVSKRIAVPGYFPTGGTITALPVAAKGLVKPDLSVVSITGTFGMGKKAAALLLRSEVMGNLRAYNAAGKHRHTAEFLQSLKSYAEGLIVSFTPVLAPTSRGILTTITTPFVDGVTETAAREAYLEFYKGEPFVQVLAEGLQPQTQSVIGSNLVQIQVEVDERAKRLVLTSATDNLTKGTGGAAVQCMNLATGQNETAGLPLVGVVP